MKPHDEISRADMFRYLTADSRMPNQQTIQNLYIPSDLDREFPLAPHFVQAFGSYPNYLHFNDDFKPSARELLDSRGFQLINHTARVNDEGWHVIERIYQHEDGVVLKAEFIGERFFRLYGFYRDELSAKGLFEGLQEHKYVHEDNQTHIYLIQSGLGGLHTERVEILPPDINLDLHYNDDFPPVHERLVNLLAQPKSKGLILLHGEPGTGKTTYIKYLSSLVRKDMLILPPYMTNYLTSPEIIPFLLDNKDSVLIIEDAERILQSREAGGDTNSVSNILNLTDGLLADCMHIQVIATFNASKHLLDKALLRKGRLMVDYAFGKLTPAKANELLMHLGMDFRTKEPMTLADIFNLDEQTVSGERQEVKMGF
ncbi:AAA family ATPase [Spirosoma taeanense]|uniref:AAA family ATPase n=1 Tax=Spirosoma taeanense TaxID=2735870 RepID=A0A6M5YBK8_9BACT|nr:AAA family ATPase [Spirosoma taeanense]QJW91329.1 AAA family ATPase [Spirosoma taeanense]